MRIVKITAEDLEKIIEQSTDEAVRELDEGVMDTLARLKSRAAEPIDYARGAGSELVKNLKSAGEQRKADRAAERFMKRLHKKVQNVKTNLEKDIKYFDKRIGRPMPKGDELLSHFDEILKITSEISGAEPPSAQKPPEAASDKSQAEGPQTELEKSRHEFPGGETPLQRAIRQRKEKQQKSSEVKSLGDLLYDKGKEQEKEREQLAKSDPGPAPEPSKYKTPAKPHKPKPEPGSEFRQSPEAEDFYFQDPQNADYQPPQKPKPTPAPSKPQNTGPQPPELDDISPYNPNPGPFAGPKPTPQSEDEDLTVTGYGDTLRYNIDNIVDRVKSSDNPENTGRAYLKALKGRELSGAPYLNAARKIKRAAGLTKKPDKVRRFTDLPPKDRANAFANVLDAMTNWMQGKETESGWLPKKLKNADPTDPVNKILAKKYWNNVLNNMKKLGIDKPNEFIAKRRNYLEE